MMQIRSLMPEETAAAADICAKNGWSGVQARFAFHAAHPDSQQFAAEVDGILAGTGTAIRRGDAGWVALLSVLPDYRGRGLGGALTAHIRDLLVSQGCRTVLLFATDMGRPVYAKLGFEVDAEYWHFRGPSLPFLLPRPRLQPLAEADWPAVAALDRAVMGEDRSAYLRAWGGPGWVIRDQDGAVTGFHLPTPWETSATTATAPADGCLLVDLARAEAGRRGEQTVYVTLPDANRVGLAYLAMAGFERQKVLPRMVWGEPPVWQPERVWGRVGGDMA